MGKRILFVILMIAVLTSAVTAFADEKLFWSNFNSDPVKNGPKYYGTFPIAEDQEPVLITRIRTFHWNSGNGAEPGQICAYENEQELQCWQAIGRSAYGSPNVYWDTLTDFVMLPGHTYGFKDSDYATWSYNDASRDRGMIELYTEDSASAAGPAPAPASDTGTVSVPAPANTGSGSPYGYAAAPMSYTVPASPTVGQTFMLGHYEQDNNFGNGAEPIEWEVLAVEGGRALVISKYALDFKAYNDVITDITWENSSLRRWLNGEFFSNAFTAAEQNQILTVTNENPDNPIFGTDGGNRTNDRIFVLSSDEAQRYFKTDAARVCKVTDYAAANYESAYSAHTSQYLQRSSSFTEALWWLRTPGDSPSKTTYVVKDGSIYFYGNSPMVLIYGTAYNEVRPAFWIKTAAPCYKVKYVGDQCLTKVPTDSKCYQPGDKVTVLFEPVDYVPGLIFNGWDRDGDGVSDHGYYYNTFPMPAKDVELHAICYYPNYDQHQQYYDVTIENGDPRWNNNNSNTPPSALYPDGVDYGYYFENGVG